MPASSRVPAKRRLSLKKQRFVEEYLKDGNGSAAALRAGYAPRSAKNRAWELLKYDPVVKDAIEAGQKDLAARNQVTLDTLIEQLQADREFAIQTENATAAVTAQTNPTTLTGFMKSEEHRGGQEE